MWCKGGSKIVLQNQPDGKTKLIKKAVRLEFILISQLLKHLYISQLLKHLYTYVVSHFVHIDLKDFLTISMTSISSIDIDQSKKKLYNFITNTRDNRDKSISFALAIHFQKNRHIAIFECLKFEYTNTSIYLFNISSFIYKIRSESLEKRVNPSHTSQIYTYSLAGFIYGR